MRATPTNRPAVDDECSDADRPNRSSAPQGADISQRMTEPSRLPWWNATVELGAVPSGRHPPASVLAHRDA